MHYIFIPPSKYSKSIWDTHLLSFRAHEFLSNSSLCFFSFESRLVYFLAPLWCILIVSYDEIHYDSLNLLIKRAWYPPGASSLRESLWFNYESFFPWIQRQLLRCNHEQGVLTWQIWGSSSQKSGPAQQFLNKNITVGEGAPYGCLVVLYARRQLNFQGPTCTEGNYALAHCAGMCHTGTLRGLGMQLPIDQGESALLLPIEGSRTLPSRKPQFGR